jgi:AraC-like DNA-binding protein
MKDYGHEYADILYYTPTEFEKLGGLWPLRSGHNTAKVNYAVGPRFIECYSFHFVLSGSVALTYRNETVILSKGDLFCLHPHLKYSYRATDNNTAPPLRMHWFAFYGNQAAPLVERIGITEQKPYLRSRTTTELETLLMQIFDLMKERQKDRDLRLQTMMYRMFALLSQPLPTDVPDRTDWLQKCLQYMDMHFLEGITVSDVVQVAGVHRSHLYSEFSNRFGISPREYLIRLRMERAVEMLKQRTLFITEISLSLGYSDLYTFSRAFCNFYGLSPSNYRKTRLSHSERHSTLMIEERN